VGLSGQSGPGKGGRGSHYPQATVARDHRRSGPGRADLQSEYHIQPTQHAGAEHWSMHRLAHVVPIIAVGIPNESDLAASQVR
jgi:hypothetical protein